MGDLLNLVIQLTIELVQLFQVDSNLIVEVVSDFDGFSDLLELVKLLLVLLLLCCLVGVDPVLNHLDLCQHLVCLGGVNVLLIVAILLDVCSQVIDVGLEVVLGCLQTQDLCIIMEHLTLNFLELLPDIGRESMGLCVIGQLGSVLSVSLLDLKLLHWGRHLLVFLSHLLVLLLGSSFLLLRWRISACLTFCFLVFGSFCLLGCWDIFLDWDFLFFSPLLKDLHSLKTGNLMDVVADSEDELELLMLGHCFLDHVLGYLGGQAWEDGSAIGVVDQQVHASLLVVKGDGLGGGEGATNGEELLSGYLGSISCWSK